MLVHLNKIPIIEVKNLYHTYMSETAFQMNALKAINFHVCEGETVGIVGPAGSGKTTLLHHLNGLLTPDQGDVLINGKSIFDQKTDIIKVRQKVCLIFQNPEDQLFERFVGDDIAFGPFNLNLPIDEVKERVNKAIELVGLDIGFKNRLTNELSPGEKRRVAIAGILAMRPDVLVLDEPMEGLDPAGERGFLEILYRWKSNKRRSVVIASHNMDVVAELADRIYVLVNGEIILNGSRKDVFTRYDKLIKNGLTVPLPVALMHGLKKRGFSVASDVVTIDEAIKEIEGLVNEKKA